MTSETDLQALSRAAAAGLPKKKASDLAQAKAALRKLLRAVQRYSEAHFFDDEEEMEKEGAKVNKAMREAREFLAKPKGKE